MSLPVEPTAAGDALLDPPPITPSRLHALEGAVAGLFETRLDIVLPQGEAVLPLEAAARGLGRPGVRALNLDTRPYGAAFGRWLRQAGATVVGIAPEFRQPVRPEAVERALQNDPDISIVSLVHVEAASCIRNDAEAITSLVREHGALLVIDVVASIGAHEVLLDGWGADIAVIGPQKALAGPAGISIAAVSRRGWQAVSANPEAPRLSLLSLLDWKERWLDSDRSAIPGTPAPLEVIALEAAVARVSREGLRNVQRRHRAAAAASRAGARALGIMPFVDDADAAVVATTLAAPTGYDARELVERARSIRDVAISPGFGELAESVIRIDHTGQRARLVVVLEALAGLGSALKASSRLGGSIREALTVAEQAWADAQAY